MQQGPSRIPGEQPDAGPLPSGCPRLYEKETCEKQEGAAAAAQPRQGRCTWASTAGVANAASQPSPTVGAAARLPGTALRQRNCSTGAQHAGISIPRVQEGARGSPKGHVCSPPKGEEHKGSPPGSLPGGAGQVTRRAWDKGQGEGPRKREAAPLALAASRWRLPEDAVHSPSPPFSFDFSPRLRAHRGPALGTVLSPGAGRPVPTAGTRCGTTGGTGRAAAKPKGQQNHKSRGPGVWPFRSRAF